MATYYAPGCGFYGYKPELAQRMSDFLCACGRSEGMYRTCCTVPPDSTQPLTMINTCAGCDRRFRTLYEGVDTVSLWEVLLETDFPFPDYNGRVLSVHDACPTRNQPQVQEAVRALLHRMNITVVEAERSREKSRCCGSTYFDAGCSAEEAVRRSQERVSDFPCPDIAVYCVGCARFLRLGGARPHHLPDLLFQEKTTIPAKPVFALRAEQQNT